LDYLLSAIVTLFVTIDPPGLAPIFVVLTAGRTRAERRATAIRAVLIAGGVLIAFALIGEPLIGFLGISLPAFRIAGGLLLFAIAFEMVFALRMERDSKAAEQAVEEHIHHIAAFPLAIPLMAGPGAITATILLSGQAAGRPVWIAILLGVIGVVMASCFVAFIAADRIGKIIGVTGNIVLSRLLGVILAALAVQFVIDGVRTAFGI
jgi:multiple antibiotic resistance protein